MNGSMATRKKAVITKLPDMSESYSQFLEKTLSKPLQASLRQLLARNPSDPIEYLANHIRHVKVDEEGDLIVEDCNECDLFHNGISESPSPTPTSDNPEENLYAAVAKESWFRVTHWRKVKVIDAWNDLISKYGNEMKWWYAARAIQNKSKAVIKPVLNRKEWKTVRVFVSSTFRDMFCEREWLVKQVFTELRSWCEERKLFLIECDLRWGVPKDSKNRDILAACLNEIDRCREENTMPYFVGLLGERYGWVPSEQDFPEDMRKQYCWLPGMSVTSLELFTGVLWDNNPHAIMMFRDPSVLNGVEKLAKDNGLDPDFIINGYREADPTQRTSLAQLKELIRRRLPASQIAEYSVTLSGMIKDGSNRLNMTGYEQFGEIVLKFLKTRIEQQFVSVSNESLSHMEIQHKEMNQFMEERGSVLFGRLSETESIREYVEQEVNDPEKMVDALIVSGSAGNGKSSLIAHAAEKCMKSNTDRVVIHFVGATAGSTTLPRVISRLWYECLDTPEHKIPTDFEQLKRSLELVFSRASEYIKSKDQTRLVVFLDAINQMDDDGETLDLQWLPKKVPHNVRLIVSTLEGQTLDALRAAKLPEVKVEPLTDDSRTKYVLDFFTKYNKKLSENQVSSLLQHADAGRPLWLSMACEELRVFGTFEQLDDKIISLSDELLGLVKQIIERIIGESPVGGDLMQAALSLIRASRFGLVETELQELLVQEPTLPEGAQLECVKRTHEPFAKDIERLPMRTWAILYLDLREFLRPVGSSGDGRLDFYHRSMSKVVRNLMLDDKRVFAKWHRRLADYFDTSVTNYRRKGEELPYHLLELQDYNRLIQVLLDDQMFDTLFREDTKVQLLMYWRELGGYKKASQLYTAAFKSSWPAAWFPDIIKNVDDDTNEEIKLWVSRVLKFSSQYGFRKKSAACIAGLNRFYPDYGDSLSAWAPKTKGGKEFLELEFETDVFINAVIIYETFHAGSVSAILALDENKSWQPIYKAEKIEDIQKSRKFKPKINRPKFKTNVIRIETDGTVCKDFVQIDAVKIIGTFAYKEESLEDLAETEGEKAGNPLLKQWVSRIVPTSKYDAPDNRINGPYSFFPNYGDDNHSWGPKTSGTAGESVELEFEREVYIAAICAYETYHSGGIRRITVRDDDGKWQSIYEAQAIYDIEESRKFYPRITRPKFKSNRIRLEVDQTVCGSSCQIDALALYGYDEYYEENIDPEQLIKREKLEDEDDDENDTSRIGQIESAIIGLSEEHFFKWLTFGVKLGWFLVDVGQFETGEKHLTYLRSVVHRRFEQQYEIPTDIGRKYAEVLYALAVLYRHWFTKFVHANNPESKRARARGKTVSAECYRIHAQYYDTEDLYFGEVIAACAFFIVEYRDEAIQLFQSKGHRRGLVDLYALKGSHAQYHDDIEHPRQFHEDSIKLTYTEFGKFHVKTARAHQLYGQTLWNRWTRYADEKHPERMEEMYSHYRTEYEILGNLYGPDHPLTVRSRENNIMMLEALHRHEEANELRKLQPEGMDIRG